MDAPPPSPVVSGRRRQLWAVIGLYQHQRESSWPWGAGGSGWCPWRVRVPNALLCLAASLPFVILTLVNSPYKRGFYCNDDSIRYPYKADTITHGLMAGVTITCTVVIVRKRHPLPSGGGMFPRVLSRSGGPVHPPPDPNRALGSGAPLGPSSHGVRSLQGAGGTGSIP